jgi:hypothetical protein
VLKCKEEESSEMHRSSVLCEVRVLNSFVMSPIEDTNKEEELVEVAPGWG